MKDVSVERTIQADEDGNVLVSCPKCEQDFKTPSNNIRSCDLVLKESIVCPLCREELDQVYPDKKNLEDMIREIKNGVVKEFGKKFKSKVIRVNL